jgi:pyruvate dehydrogenase E2 component (dihydrolipoamide acetyltransferase)
MAMAIEIVMPRLGWNMEAGTVVEWLKRDGDRVEPGEYLFLVEGDKSTTEVEALDGGTLRIPENNLRVGEELPVGTLLAYLVQDDEVVPASSPALTTVVASSAVGAIATATTSSAPIADPAQSAPVGGADGDRARRRRAPVASPRARRVAAQLGVDWTTLSGSSRSGRIVEADVRAAAQTGATTATPTITSPPQSPAPQPAQAGVVAAGARVATSVGSPTDPAAEPLTGIRRLTAERMATSARTAAAVTLTTDADATARVAARAELAAGLAGSESPVPTYNDFFARLVALTLRDFPDLNAALTDAGVVRHAAAHIGLAVDTPRGLLVPVLRGAGTRPLQELAADSARQRPAARAGRLDPAAQEGGTFTITNLGPYGIDAFTPIINPPQCAILGIGRIAARPVVLDEESGTIGVRKMVALSLTFDHRIIDGGPAARFLQRIRDDLARPLVWLTR